MMGWEGRGRGGGKGDTLHGCLCRARGVSRRGDGGMFLLHQASVNYSGSLT